jgi:hypothetical protein
MAEHCSPQQSVEEYNDAVLARDGWIKHDGGPCPVEADLFVDAMCANNHNQWTFICKRAGDLEWAMKAGGDAYIAYISAYRLHTPAPDKDALIAELRQVVKAFIDETCDYMQINNLGDPEKQHNVIWGRAILAKTGGHG